MTNFPGYQLDATDSAFSVFGMTVYPANTKEFNEAFKDDATCLEYLYEIRWPNGFVCPVCKTRGRFWRLAKGRIKCQKCRHTTSILSGTIFQDTHTPPLTWFRIIWHLCLQKNGYSAMSMQRSLDLTYATSWLCLHKLRKAMVRPGRELLHGEVELDEVRVGERHRLAGDKAPLEKSIVLIAVERKRTSKGHYVIGRARLQVLPDITRKTLTQNILSTIEKGSTIITDSGYDYSWLKIQGYQHFVSSPPLESLNDIFLKPRIIKEDSPLPKCNRIVNLLKRWILGTHQGSMSRKHLQDYLNEFVFRFNRRSSKARGMLFWRMLQQAVTYGPTHREKLLTPTSSGSDKSVASS